MYCEICEVEKTLAHQELSDMVDKRIIEMVGKGRSVHYQMKWSTRHWYYNLCKGKVRSYVAREKETLAKITKTIKTLLEKKQISMSDLEKILSEVEVESVESFREQSFYLDRRKRLNRIKETLNKSPDSTDD